MTRTEFRKQLKKQILVLDGATGTELQNRGMPRGVCPEKWVLDNPRVLREVQEAYTKAGAQGVYSCTFGGNRLKLAEFGLQDQAHDLNRDLARLSRKIVGEAVLVAGDMSPTGRFVAPFGDLPFEEAVDIYREQARGLLEGGVDFFMVETMVDVQEARAAVLALREICDLPVCVSLTFDESGRTLTGTDPHTAVMILQNLGVDALGCNCSMGPRPMRTVVETMAEVARVPLLALPNAGIPRLVRNETVFSLTAREFVAETLPIAKTAAMIGGCCGTSPEYIQELADAVAAMPVPPMPEQQPQALASARMTVQLGPGRPVLVVGERINPTGKEKLKSELRECKTGEIRRLALEQGKAGADLLDVNVGASGVDEKAAMTAAVDCLCTVSDLPLCIDSSDPAVVEKALRMYPGRALVNSVSGETGKADAMLPIVARYGAMFIALPLDDQGIPASAKERMAIVEKLQARAAEVGLDKDSMIVDGLVMTVSSDQAAAAETLRLVEWTEQSFGAGTIVGLSNVSFGLPARQWINAGFLAMAAQRGLRMMIANPSDEVLMNTKRACDVLTGSDAGARRYAAHFAPRRAPEPEAGKLAGTPLEPVHEGVLEGDRENIVPLIDSALDAGTAPERIMKEAMVPAITRVGELFEKHIYFLPQLIRSAEAMRTGFEHLEPLMSETEEAAKKRAVILLATVAGDIHDIGKSIVAVMLRNYGFDVRDLGKDVDTEGILDAAEESAAPLVGLSALMTTTMGAMKEVLDQARVRGLTCKFMIGGAAVDRAFAAEIGADGYADDAYSAVKEAERLLG